MQRCRSIYLKSQIIPVNHGLKITVTNIYLIFDLLDDIGVTQRYQIVDAVNRQLTHNSHRYCIDMKHKSINPLMKFNY